MSDAAGQLRVDALAEVFAQAGAAAGTEPADSEQLLELASTAPVVRLVDAVLSEAVTRRASDVHVEAFERDVFVRYRIDGRCYRVAEPPKSLALAIASRLKVMANLDVAESRLPQDGRILLTVQDRSVDLRISTLPTVHGESIVLRVLDKGAVSKTLEELGMQPAMRETIGRLSARPHGLLLVTGPTGAGKTTTLYACLAARNTPEEKVITTEDPVEYDVGGLVQVAVSEKIGLSFATCLRAILRHDPDVIMVGEIRDQETAQVAIQSALTGHLVLSTLHTNDAPGAVTRLLDMGLEPFLLTSTLTGVLAQRLVRVVCPACRRPRPATVEEQAALGPAGGQTAQALMEPVGCAECSGLGYRGRTGLFELLVMDERLHPLILNRAPAADLRAQAQAAGMQTLREDGVQKVLAGVTTLAEVLRETQDYG